MRILQVNKFYHINGGADRYFLDVINLLEKNGHDVAVFSTNDPRNKNTKWSKYFLRRITFNGISDICNILNFIYSFEAKRKITKLLDDFRPDIVHLHNYYHHISPSIIQVIRNRNIPIVMTVHDYHLISPNYNMFHNGRICEITKPNKFYKAIFHKCVRESYFYSTIEVLEKYIYEFVKWEKKDIDKYIIPCDFLRDKLISTGINSSKIKLLRLFTFISANRKNKNRDYILFFGRLSSEKGLDILINAMKYLPNISLKIIGTGLNSYVIKLKKLAKSQKNISFYGYLPSHILEKMIADSKFIIVPSVWNEISPLTIYESFASAKPVIASNIGGIPELVKDGYNGILFEPGNVDDLADKIDILWSNPALCQKMGRNAREYVEKYHGPVEHYERLMKVYKLAIKHHE